MMKLMQNFRLLPIIILAAVVLSACGAAAPAEPTQDPNAIFTQVAETVMVSMTQTSESMPPTPEPEPTATTAPTLQMAPTSDLNAQPTNDTSLFGPTATIQRFGDSAKWMTNNPADGSSFSPSKYFTITACFLNDGATDWDKTYYLEWMSGYRLWPDTKYFYVEQITKPGEKWCFTLPAVAPTDPGSYITRWYFKNKQGHFMEEDYFPFKVVI